MIKVLILLAILLTGCASFTSKINTVPLEDHEGQMHEYLRFPEFGSDVFCLIHQEYEKVERKIKDTITVALH